MTPTFEQQTITTAARDTTDNLLISALAGAAKTTTLVLIAEALPNTQMLTVAFNVRIAKEMADRLPKNCEARTLNSLGHGSWSQTIGRRLVVDKDKTYRLLKAAVDALPASDRSAAYATFSDTKRAIEMGKMNGYIPDGAYAGKAKPLMGDDAVEDLFEEAPNDLQLSLLRQVTRASLAESFRGTIDYNDQILMPACFPAIFPSFPLVLIDEAQDLSPINHAMLRKFARKRLIAVGDPNQCQPAGTLVTTPTGQVPIELLTVNDEVIAYHRDSQHLRPRRVLATANRHYKGNLFKIVTLGGSYEATPNHRCVARLREDRLDWNAVYLMRKENKFRVGKTILHRKDQGTFGLALRARQEKADAVWLLAAFPTKEEALANEQVITSVFGVPDLCFINSGELAISQERLDWCWNQIGNNIHRALEVLKEYNKEIDFPIWEKGTKDQVGTRQCMIRACNLDHSLFEVPVAIKGGVEYREFELFIRYFEGLVYSLDIEKTVSTNGQGLYFANGILTGNCIYSFRGAMENSMDILRAQYSMREFPLSVSFRCPIEVVKAARFRTPQMLWPDWAKPGAVTILREWAADTIPDFGAIICRNNAPLFAMAIRLLTAGRYPELVGSDIGKTLLKWLKQLGDEDLSRDDALDAVDKWQQDRAQKVRDPAKAADQAMCLRVFVERGETLGAAITFATTVLNAAGPIKLMTIHRSKGLEFDHIFLLDRELIRVGAGQESNVLYVAITRAKETLTYITSEGYIDAA